MDFSETINSIQQSPNSGALYVFAGFAIILSFYVAKKVLRILTFFFIFGLVGIALVVLQGGDISTFTDPVITYGKQLAANCGITLGGMASSDNGGSSNNSSPANIEKMISQALSKNK